MRNADAILEQRTARLAARLVDEADNDGGQLAVAVTVASERLLLEYRCVAEVLPPGPITSVPGAGQVIGVRNVRGRIVPVADLGSYVSLQSPLPPSERATVVLGEGEDALGLLVDAAELATAPPASHLLPPPDDLREHTCVVGLSGDGAIVLDAERILQSPELHPTTTTTTPPNDQGAR